MEERKGTKQKRRGKKERGVRKKWVERRAEERRRRRREGGLSVGYWVTAVTMTYKFICARRLIRPVLCSTSPRRPSGWRDAILGWNTEIKKQKVGVASGRGLDSDKCSEFGSVFLNYYLFAVDLYGSQEYCTAPCRLAVVKLIHPPWKQTSHFSSLLFRLTFSLTLLIKVARHPDCWQISFMRWEKMKIS